MTKGYFGGESAKLNKRPYTIMVDYTKQILSVKYYNCYQYIHANYMPVFLFCIHLFQYTGKHSWWPRDNDTCILMCVFRHTSNILCINQMYIICIFCQRNYLSILFDVLTL